MLGTGQRGLNGVIGLNGLNGKTSARSTGIRTEVGPVSDPGCGTSAHCCLPPEGRAWARGRGRRTDEHAQKGTNENILPVIYTYVNDRTRPYGGETRVRLLSSVRLIATIAPPRRGVRAHQALVYSGISLVLQSVPQDRVDP